MTASGPVPVCRVLELCPGTYYGRKRRPPSARARRDAVPIEQINDVHQANFGLSVMIWARNHPHQHGGALHLRPAVHRGLALGALTRHLPGPR